MSEKPFIAADQQVAELNFRVIILAIILTILLAMSNAYLALKLGILTSASIPAAIISMGILHFFKNSTILENNAVQTAASAGEAVSGGIVYTIPALIIIGYWTHFDYLTNCFIAACGGVLGVLFSIPLRRILVHDPLLKFPEGRAIAEVLKSTANKAGIKDIFIGGAIGGVIELFQVGFKVIANSWSYWFVVKRSLFGLGAGFSATMIGAGYLVGHGMALSIILGAIISWLIAFPIASQFYPEFLNHHPPAEAATLLWNSEMRYLGIGAMLFAGVWTFIKLIKPLSKSIAASFQVVMSRSKNGIKIPRTDRDIPLPFIVLGIGIMSVVLFLFFQFLFPLSQAGLTPYSSSVVFFGVIYVLLMGFLFSVITAYFSGMVGVTASPGSSVVIAGMLFAAWLLLTVVNHILPLPLSAEQIQAAEAITIIVGAVVTGSAAIANDNTQDLKKGEFLMFDWPPNYQPANPLLWQGRDDTIHKERFFQRIMFIQKQSDLLSTDRKTIFLGFASDAGIKRNLGRPGATLGPDQIKTHLAKLPCPMKNQFIDLGTIFCVEDQLESAQTQFAEVIHFCHQQGHKTVGFGGGHELAWAHYQGLWPHYPRLGIINFDAHFDLRPHQEGQPGTSGTPFSQIASSCRERSTPFNYCCIGIQKWGNTAELFQRAKELNVSYLFAEEIHEKTKAWQIAFLDEFMLNLDYIYVSICLDVLAECFAPGVSAPQALGLTPWQILPLLKYIFQSGKVVSWDVAELSPPLDQDQKTARLAALIVAELLDIN